MADAYFAVSVKPSGACSFTSRGPDGIDALVTAVGTDLDSTCDTALAVPAIDADVDSENAVEAIRTAVDAALAAVTTARTAENGGDVLVRYDTTLTRTQLAAALERVLFEVRQGLLLS